MIEAPADVGARARSRNHAGATGRLAASRTASRAGSG